MKHYTINSKKKYKINKTVKKRSFFQKGGKRSSLNITAMIKSSSQKNEHIISPQDTLYPTQYIGYSVFVPADETPFTIDQLLETDETEGTFVKNGKIVVDTLDRQIYLDMNRSTILVNNQPIYNSFKEKVDNEAFVSELASARKQVDEEKFTKELQKIFKDLHVDKDEYDAIYALAQNNTNLVVPEFWAVLPYFDEILNINGITKNEYLTRTKFFCQQSISKTLLDLLMKFVSYTHTISHNIFYIGGLSQALKIFGSKSTNYINQLPSGLNIRISVNRSDRNAGAKGNPPEIILEQKLYQSLVNIDNEFGLAVIDTTIYVDITKNKFFYMWKIDRWRNVAIKNYYKFILNMNSQGWTVPENLFILMNSNMCNNMITDDFPNSQQALLDYFMAVFKYYIPQLKMNMKGGSEEEEEETKVAESKVDEDEAKVDEEEAKVDEDEAKVDEEEATEKVDVDEAKVDEEKVDEEEAKVDEEEAKVDEEKVNEEEAKVDEDEDKVDESKEKEDEEEAKVDEEEAKVDESKEKVDEEEAKVDEEKEKVDESKEKVDEEEAKVDEEKVGESEEKVKEVEDKYTSKQIDSLTKALSAINDIINENWKTMNDSTLQKTIRKKTLEYVSIKKRITNMVSKTPDVEQIVDTTAPIEQTDKESNDTESKRSESNDTETTDKTDTNDTEQNATEQNATETNDTEQNATEPKSKTDIIQDKMVDDDMQKLNADDEEINKARINLEKAQQQRDTDLTQLRNDQPDPTPDDKLINNLVTAGTVGALAAVGTGLFFAAPLLSGGQESRKRKRKFKLSKTIKHV